MDFSLWTRILYIPCEKKICLSLKFKLYLSSRGRLRYKPLSAKGANRREKASKACGGYLNKLLEVKAVFRGVYCQGQTSGNS